MRGDSEVLHGFVLIDLYGYFCALMVWTLA